MLIDSDELHAQVRQIGASLKRLDGAENAVEGLRELVASKHLRNFIDTVLANAELLSTLHQGSQVQQEFIQQVCAYSQPRCETGLTLMEPPGRRNRDSQPPVEFRILGT